MLNQTWEVEVASFDIPTGADAIAEGERVFRTRGCGGCHGEDAGGKVFFEMPAVGVLYTSNLTNSGIGRYYETADYIRAIQHGIGPDGHALIEMPSAQFQHMRVDEIGPLIAYLQSLPPVDNDLHETRIDFLGRVVMGLGLFPAPAAFVINHSAAGPVEASATVSIEYGEGLAAQMCISCHQANLAGGSLAFEPSTVVPNITFHEEGIAGWTLDDFVTTIRTGINPDGKQLKAPMPWESLALLRDDELESLYLYLQSVEPVPQGK
jgi:mono/diheme cytochrome c family protein